MRLNARVDHGWTWVFLFVVFSVLWLCNLADEDAFKLWIYGNAEPYMAHYFHVKPAEPCVCR